MTPAWIAFRQPVPRCRRTKANAASIASTPIDLELSRCASKSFSAWDPIGIRDVPRARDEYDSYARPIAELITAKISVPDLSRHLLDIETKAMGLAGNQKRALAVAQKLCAIAKA